MGLFLNAIASNEVTYDKGAIEADTTYNLGDGSHIVRVTGSGTDVSVGDGGSSIRHYGDNASVSAGDGWNHVTSLGNNKNITTGENDDDVVFIGDSVNVETEGGNDDITFWGNDCNIKTGDGNDSVTTYDQAYKSPEFSHLSEDFLDRLETGTWEDWKLKSSVVIDQYTKKKWHGKTKTTTVYERHYDVSTYFARYINGVENTNIDLGDGEDSANVTLGTGSDISSELSSSLENDDSIVLNDKWQIDTLTGVRDEVKIEKETKSGWSWSTFIAPCTRVVGGFLQVLGVCTVAVGIGYPIMKIGEHISQSAWEDKH